MKVAITAKDAGLGCRVDPRFGRAPYLLIVDTASGRCDTYDNHANAESFSGAGVQTAKVVVDSGVEALISGSMGPKALSVLQAGGVQVYAGIDGTAQDALRSLAAGQLKPIGRANVDGHWA